MDPEDVVKMPANPEQGDDCGDHDEGDYGASVIRTDTSLTQAKKLAYVDRTVKAMMARDMDVTVQFHDKGFSISGKNPRKPAS